MEATGAIIERLFNIQGKEAVISRSLKARYLLFYLSRHWTEVVGGLLASQCCAERLERGVLYVRTADSMLAHQLFIMRKDFLAKVNAVLAGKAKVRGVSFFAATLPPLEGQAGEEGGLQPGPAYSPTPCPRCGARRWQGEELCSICRRELKEEEAKKIAELLQAEPYLSYQEADFILGGCPRLLFQEEREKLVHYYCERVRNQLASEEEEQLAVLLLTGKRPAQISSSQWQNCLQHLRRKEKEDVSASRL